jgi:hypothetical protein
MTNLTNVSKNTLRAQRKGEVVTGDEIFLQI